jgi:hypothetical protein
MLGTLWKRGRLFRSLPTLETTKRQAIRFAPILLPISPCHSPWCNPGEVDNPAFGKRPAIVQPHFHRLAIVEVGYPYDAFPRKSSMRGDPLFCRPTFAAMPQI